jgi:alpha-tubulin suppressor-like RCC1 family protein
MRATIRAAAVAAIAATVLAAGPAVAGAAASSSVQWAQVSAGPESTCAVQTGHTLWCWGSGGDGELGDGSTADQDSPVRVGARAGWTQAAVGIGHACAVRKDGTAWCWGSAFAGQLGNGTTTGQYDRPVQVTGGGDYTAISAGTNNACAIRTDGTLWCWGDDELGQTGNGTVTFSESTPVQAGTATDWTSVSVAGINFACGVHADHSAWCWGYGGWGNLGNGTETSSDTPVQVSGGDVWTSVSAGSESACGTRTDGTVWCWGANSFDETGRSGNALEPSPVQVGTRTGWTAVSAGIAACALYGPTTLWCWGSNFSGQIGQGVTGHEYPNPRIVGTSANWIRVSAGAGDVNDGRSSVCGIQRGWSLWCWGDNQEGQLGLGTTGGSKNTPQQVG